MTKPVAGRVGKAVASGRAGPGLRGKAAALSSASRAEIDSFIVMDVMTAATAKEAQGHTVIHMEVGQPGTPAPKLAREALRGSLDADNLGYTLALGEDRLRQRIAQYYGETYGVDLDPRRVVVTAGSSGGFLLAFTALFDAGAAVGLPSPGYPCYRQILKALDLCPALIETTDEGRWMPTAHDVVEAHRNSDLKGLLIASPANPTGTMIQSARLSELVQLCEELGLWFISDEIYHGLSYDEPAATALSFGNDAIIINSFSKYFSMTGWRVGWMVVPERLVRVFERLAQNLFICAPAASQVAALGAFEGIAELEANKATYAKNRELLLRELPKAGFEKIVPADGAFYLYCDVTALLPQGTSSVELAAEILDEALVAVTPGLDFDPARGSHFLRFSYARSHSDIVEAARRLIAWKERRSV